MHACMIATTFCMVCMQNLNRLAVSHNDEMHSTTMQHKPYTLYHM